MSGIIDTLTIGKLIMLLLAVNVGIMFAYPLILHNSGEIDMFDGEWNHVDFMYDEVFGDGNEDIGIRFDIEGDDSTIIDDETGEQDLVELEPQDSSTFSNLVFNVDQYFLPVRNFVRAIANFMSFMMFAGWNAGQLVAVNSEGLLKIIGRFIQLFYFIIGTILALQIFFGKNKV